MPHYDYHCSANSQVIEVKHKMSEKITTWGELCESSGTDPGDTPVDSPVEKLISGGNIVSSSNMGSGTPPRCPSGGCGSGMCGLG
jgi:hypothetical protein